MFTLKPQQAKPTISSDIARSIPIKIEDYFKLEAGTGFILLVGTENHRLRYYNDDFPFNLKT